MMKARGWIRINKDVYVATAVECVLCRCGQSWKEKERRTKRRKEKVKTNAFVPDLIMESNLGGTLWCKCAPEEAESWTSRLSVCPRWVSTLHLQQRRRAHRAVWLVSAELCVTAQRNRAPTYNVPPCVCFHLPAVSTLQCSLTIKNIQCIFS